MNIPILANLYLAKGLAFKTGLQPGFVMGAKIDDTPVTDGCNTVTFAVPVGLSYTFSCGLLFDVRYQIGLSNVFKEQDKYRNGVFSIMAGWSFEVSVPAYLIKTGACSACFYFTVTVLLF